MSRKNVSPHDPRYNTNGSRFWTQAELRLLLVLWSGRQYSIEGIARELSKIGDGRTPTAVAGKGRAMCLPPRAYEKRLRAAPAVHAGPMFEDDPRAPRRERPWRDGRYSPRPVPRLERSLLSSSALLCLEMGEADMTDWDLVRGTKRARSKRDRARAAAKRMEAAE